MYSTCLYHYVRQGRRCLLSESRLTVPVDVKIVAVTVFCFIDPHHFMSGTLNCLKHFVNLETLK